jgi:hypothetical protein
MNKTYQSKATSNPPLWIADVPQQHEFKIIRAFCIMKYLNIIQPENNLTEKLTVSLQNTQMLTLMHLE